MGERIRPLHHQRRIAKEFVKHSNVSKIGKNLKKFVKLARIMTRRKIIGARVRLLETIRSKGGVVINRGEEATITQSYRGYGVSTDDKREINRIEHWKVEFIEK